MQSSAYSSTATESPTFADEPVPGEVFGAEERAERAVEFRRLTGRPPITVAKARHQIAAQRRWQYRNLARQSARAGLGAVGGRTCGRPRGRRHGIIARARSSVAGDDDGESAPWWRRWSILRGRP